MSAVWGQAKADFLERVRRFSFLAMIALAVFLAYWFVPGVSETNAIMEEMLIIEPDVFVQGGNASWIPVASAVGSALFLSAIGFFYLLSAITFDEKTGVEQLISSSTTGNLRYLFGKFIGGTLILYAFAAAVLLGSFLMMLWHFPGQWLSFRAFFSPYLFLIAGLPFCAALATLFGSLRFLRGAIGPLVFFTSWVILSDIGMRSGDPSIIIRAFDVSGWSGMVSIVARSVYEVSGVVTENIAFFGGYPPAYDIPPTLQLVFEGLRYSSEDFAVLGLSFLLAIGFTVLSAPIYTKMKQFAGLKRKSKKPTENIVEQDARSFVPVYSAVAPSKTKQWGRGIQAELKLMLKGQNLIWAVIAIAAFAANIVLPLFLEMNLIYGYAVPLMMLWFVTVFSNLGSREHQNDMLQLIAAIPGGKGKQAVYSWAAGLLVASILALPLIAHLLFASQFAGAFAAFAGAILLPSAALFFGVFTKTSRVFEIILIFVTFMIMNDVRAAMFIGYPGVESFAQAAIYLAAGIAFGISAILRRQAA